LPRKLYSKSIHASMHSHEMKKTQDRIPIVGERTKDVIEKEKKIYVYLDK